MTPKLFVRFIETATRVSPSLRQAFADIGPVSIPDRSGKGLAYLLSRVIIGQQLSTKAAHSIWGRIEEAVGETGSRIPDFFRDENALLLRQCGVSHNKIRALCGIPVAHEEGTLSPESLGGLNAAQRSEHLQTLRGVGPWTADMMSIFYFGEADVWPQSDTAVRKTFDRFVHEGSGLRMAEAADLFRPYRSYLAIYMWQIVARMP